MSLGLPAHLAPQSISYAVAHALHGIAVVSLASAFLIVGVLQLATPSLILWPALLALIPMGFLLVQVDRRDTIFSAVSYLLIGSACTYLFTVATIAQSDPIRSSDSFTIVLVKVALILAGGPAMGAGFGVIWCAAGYVLAEFAVILGTLTASGFVRFDVSAFTVFVLVTAVLVVVGQNRYPRRKAQPSLHRAARDEALAAVRTRVELKAAALMHDTVLNHLAAIADSPRETIAPELRETISHDLDVLVGQEWLIETPRDQSSASAETLLDKAAREVRELGLTVTITGDVYVLARLSADSAEQLALAVKQCLVNVVKHAETDRAEVAVYGSDTDISVMVIDTGRGFEVHQLGSDRLGLRNSVLQRIEAIGGAVQLWSTPGRGTSVMIRVPISESAIA